MPLLVSARSLTRAEVNLRWGLDERSTTTFGDCESFGWRGALALHGGSAAAIEVTEIRQFGVGGLVGMKMLLEQLNEIILQIALHTAEVMLAFARNRSERVHAYSGSLACCARSMSSPLRLRWSQE
jgi:hypothetical protein